jgi:LEA14-like dessication related protein
MKVYPSPANDWIVAETNSGETNQILNIYNSQGSIVKTVKINHDCQRIDVSDLRGGLYIVEVKSTSKTSTKKIMVQR